MKTRKFKHWKSIALQLSSLVLLLALTIGALAATIMILNSPHHFLVKMSLIFLTWLVPIKGSEICEEIARRGIRQRWKEDSEIP